MCSRHEATKIRTRADSNAVSIDFPNCPLPTSAKDSSLKKTFIPALLSASYTPRAAMASGVALPSLPEFLNEINTS